jgi:hypothetical protein
MRWWREKFSAPAGKRTLEPHHPARSLIATPTELSRFLLYLTQAQNGFQVKSGYSPLVRIKVKVKLSLCFLTERHAMKVYWGMEVKFRAFLRRL